MLCVAQRGPENCGRMTLAKLSCAPGNAIVTLRIQLEGTASVGLIRQVPSAEAILSLLLLVLSLMRCDHAAGHIRIIPLLQHRMLLVAFKQPPSVRVSLSLSAPLFKTALSPGDLGQLNFIQGLIGSAIKGSGPAATTLP